MGVNLREFFNENTLCGDHDFPSFEHDMHPGFFLMCVRVCTRCAFVLTVWICTNLIACMVCIGACIYSFVMDMILCYDWRLFIMLVCFGWPFYINMSKLRSLS